MQHKKQGKDVFQGCVYREVSSQCLHGVMKMVFLLLFAALNMTDAVDLYFTSEVQCGIAQCATTTLPDVLHGLLSVITTAHLPICNCPVCGRITT